MRQFEMSGAEKPHLHEMATPSPFPKQSFSPCTSECNMYVCREKRTLSQLCCSKETCHCMCLAFDIQWPQQTLHDFQEPQYNCISSGG